MAPNRDLLLLELQDLSKNELIELLVFSKNLQKTQKLRNIKIQVDNLNHDEKINEANTSITSLTVEITCGKCKRQEELNEEIVSKLENCSNVYNKTGGLDNFVGAYMAYSIFHGYLKIVIPRTGTTEPHLQELMQTYEDKNDIKFANYKLYLLVPKSTYCPTSLEELSKRIQACQHLDEKLVTRAGVQNRSYKNSVYKIFSKEGKKSTFAVAEYATPLKTYKDVFTYNYGEDSDAYKQNKDKVVEKFYTSLLKILQEHEDCTNYCELIYYNDKNEDGSFKDVADILMDRINKINNQ